MDCSSSPRRYVCLENHDGTVLTGGNEELGENPVAVSSIIPTWTYLDTNPVLRGDNSGVARGLQTLHRELVCVAERYTNNAQQN
jgi:hypothetical protein